MSVALAGLLVMGLAHAGDGQPGVDPSIYTQAGFNAEPSVKEFADWQRRFQADWDAMFSKEQTGRSDQLIEQAPGLFANSIESSKKGLSLKSYLVKSIFAGDARIASPGVIAKRMMLNESAKPVGLGGKYEQDGYTVEIWYMALHDIRALSMAEFKSAAAYSAFEKLELPKLNAGTRGTWPVLLFTRNKTGQLMLYGHSKEMLDISARAADRQYY
ncbi:hypothetical protein [Pseudoduganella sp.]|uniref:hypothetical protein n=1 Tax=Pseudoduganella sp. TaxID=1880898 RepID=UPI0035B2E3AF